MIANHHTGCHDPNRAHAAMLARQPFAEGLDEPALACLLAHAVPAQLAEDEFLFSQDSVAEYFYIVLQGELKLHRLSIAGDEKIVGQVEAGDSFAEGIAFMKQPRYPVHAQATRTSEVLGISRRVYRQQLMEAPAACLAIMSMLTDRIQNLLNEVENLTLHSSRDRVIRFLLGLTRRQDCIVATHGTAMTIRLPSRKHSIASRLSIRAETLSRILTALIAQQLLERTSHTNELYIPDPEQLRQALNPSCPAPSLSDRIPS